MSVLERSLAGPEAGRRWLASINPIAQLLAIAAITVTALSTVDLLTPSVLVAVELALFPAAGLTRPGEILRRTWPILLSAAGVAWVNLLFAEAPGWDWSGSAALAVRVLAVALPGVPFVASTDPVRIADALTIHWHLPNRLAYGALAAVRLAPLLVTEWRSIQLARRARGVDAGRSPIAVGRLFFGAAFALLVGAIRRASRLAVSMDARGFDSVTAARTNARGSVLRHRDYAYVAVAVTVCLAATTAAVLTGLWHPLFAG